MSDGRCRRAIATWTNTFGRSEPKWIISLGSGAGGTRQGRPTGIRLASGHRASVSTAFDKVANQPVADEAQQRTKLDQTRSHARQPHRLDDGWLATWAFDTHENPGNRNWLTHNLAMAVRPASTVTSRNTARSIARSKRCRVTTRSNIYRSSEAVLPGSVRGSSPLSSTLHRAVADCAR